MSHAPTLPDVATDGAPKPVQKRRIVNALWQPFVQFKLLGWMLGTTAVVAVMLGAFFYHAFGDLVALVSGRGGSDGYYGQMVEVELVHLFRYCGALFVLYILLLAAVCVSYTHRLIGPLRPFTRHVESLVEGDFSSRVQLRRGDLDVYVEHAEKLNRLAETLQARDRQG